MGECRKPGCDAPVSLVNMGFASSTEIEGYSIIQAVECDAGHDFLYAPPTDRDPCECIEDFDLEEWVNRGGA